MISLGLDRAELHRCWDRIADSGVYTEGQYTRLFEEEVSKRHGLHAVAVNSCGSGLFALYRMFKPTEVVVPVNTFFATGAMAREAGHTVRLADCAPFDFSMGLEEVIAAVTPDTKMIVLTHVGGWLANDYEAIAMYCSHRNIALIEDAAHVFGADRMMKVAEKTRISTRITAGALGTAAVFSLYPTKAVPVGEGGVIVTSDRGLAERLREFRNYGKYPVAKGIVGYNQGRLGGFNLRMDEWTAAVAYLQTQRLRDIVDSRANAAARLMEVVPPYPNVTELGNNWYKYPVAASFEAKKTTGKIYQKTDQLTTALGIEGTFPNALQLADSHICVPVGERLYEGMSTEEIERWLKTEDDA